MEDLEEKLVLNFVEEAIDNSNNNNEVIQVQVDENSNNTELKSTIKQKSLKVVLEKGKFTPKRKKNGVSSQKKKGPKTSKLVKKAAKNGPADSPGSNSTKSIDSGVGDLDGVCVKQEDSDLGSSPLKKKNGTKNSSKKSLGVDIKSPKFKTQKGQTTLDSFFKVQPKNEDKSSLFKCDKCLYVGNSRANMDRHLLIHNDPDDILWYQCTDCDYRSKYEYQLKSHTLVHLKPEEKVYFQCPHCEQKCLRKHNLTAHIKTAHAEKDNCFKCAECPYSTFAKDRLAAHVKTHSKEVHYCHLCNFVTKRPEYMKNHIKSVHMDMEKPYPCDTCSYKGKTKKELDKHYDRMHNKEKCKTFDCKRCDFSSIYKKNFEFHMLHVHQNSEGFQKYICGHCSKEFVYKSGLKVHIVRMHLKMSDDDWHKCQECKYKSKDVHTLKRHIKRNHGAPRLFCPKCDFVTNRQGSMDAHQKTHKSGAKNQILKCSLCPYRIIQISSFVYHMKAKHEKQITSKDLNKYYNK